MTSAYIFDIVISKFSYQKNSSLIILLIVHKSPKVGFYYTILLFNLAINLTIKGNREPLLDL